MLEKTIENLVLLFKNNGYNVEFSDINIITKLFMFYHYYNADETLIDTLYDNSFDYDFLEGINERDESDEGLVELVKTLNITIEDFNVDEINEKLAEIDIFYAKLFSGYKSDELNDIREVFLERNISDEDEIQFVLLTDLLISPDEKSKIKEIVTNYKSKLEKLNYVIFFADDLEEFVSDVDKPSINVEKGSIFLSSEKQLFYHGEERSIVASISAKSLKQLFLDYSTTGLFSSNLRYYVKSSKIDSKIKESIIEEPEKFWYFNNGLIITCDNYKISGNRIDLYNFSIVNGGQTTNLIGNTPIIKDFSLVCKIIRTKFQDKDENLAFLSKVAETSNTQKPIKMKDIIANRVEQKKLQIQLKTVNVYVQIKRGEKINKTIYKEQWQNAKNDEIGQMLFAFIYQHPGIARNSKSKMLSNDVYYDTIYKNQYNTLLLLGLQHFKVGYHKWKLRVKRLEIDIDKNGLSRNGYFLFLAIFGIIVKYYYNKNLRKLIATLSNDHDIVNDLELKMKLSQNDIGELAILNNPSLISSGQGCYDFFDFLYDKFVLPVYQNFKENYPGYAYSNFTKNDTHYYRSALPKVFSLLKEQWKFGIDISLFAKKYFITSKGNEVDFVATNQTFEEYKPGLSYELTEYRRSKYRELQGKIQAYKIFTNNQRSKITFYKPDSLETLGSDCGLTVFSIKNFGEDILKIVEKYKVI